MTAYRILAIDGGGVRGVFAARLLDRLQQETGFLDSTQLLAGTSTGGLIALSLASGHPAAEVAQLYLDHAREIFDFSLWKRIESADGILGTRYDNHALRKVVHGVLGDRKLADLEKRVLVPTFDLDNGDGPVPLDADALRTWKPKFFHNFSGKDSDGEEKAEDVAVRTCSAPIFLPTYQGYIDGGVMANNPAMAALSLALHADGAGKSIDEVRLFSLSCGTSSQYVSGDHAWGAVGWGTKIIELMIGGTSGVADYECNVILGPARYFRFDPTLEASVALDDAHRVRDLYEWAGRVPIERAVHWLNDFFLTPASSSAETGS